MHVITTPLLYLKKGDTLHRNSSSVYSYFTRILIFPRSREPEIQERTSSKETLHPCLTDPNKQLILLGVSSQALAGELETQICLGFAWGRAFPMRHVRSTNQNPLPSYFDQSNCSVHHYIISQFSNISDYRFQKRDSSGRIPWGLLGVCLGCDEPEPMLGDVRFTMFAWGFDTFFACGWIFRVVCLGMRFSGSSLLGDVDFGTSFAWGFPWGEFAWVCETEVFQLRYIRYKRKGQPFNMQTQKQRFYTRSPPSPLCTHVRIKLFAYV